MENLWIIAKAEIEKGEPVGTEGDAGTIDPAGNVNDPNGAGKTGDKPGRFGSLQIMLLVLMVFFVIMMFRGPKKKQQEHRKMLQSLQKNDRVRTIGGIYGTIVDVRDDEIVLKVDESNNTKIKISPNAIGTKVSEEKS